MMRTIGLTASTIAAIVALLAVAGSTMALLGQVEVADDAVGVTRTCGSALDSAIDRSGWDQWWASDVGEPDPEVAAALVRTRRCPDAVNRRLALAAALGVLAVGSAHLARPRRGTRSGPDAAMSAGGRLTRLGRVSTWVGVSLTVAGLAAVVVLVGDADSTLFLYTDRLVVAVVGLLVLTPTVALVVIGRVLTLLGSELDRETEPGDV